MFRLDLSDQEHQLLKELLNERLQTVREEIHRSATFSFRDQLKKEKEILLALSERMEYGPGQVCGCSRGQYYAGPVECEKHFILI
ncbi:MAG: hypothetical protein HYR96_12320 [Deltaproteobacteria bacterium]|nr:hypothetical protein [Deltaproteobacteria bacterium]MBI3296040.1 hypothetical protein [Deltaproteobacteria bacterium]